MAHTDDKPEKKEQSGFSAALQALANQRTEQGTVPVGTATIYVVGDEKTGER